MHIQKSNVVIPVAARNQSDISYIHRQYKQIIYTTVNYFLTTVTEIYTQIYTEIYTEIYTDFFTIDTNLNIDGIKI